MSVAEQSNEVTVSGLTSVDSGRDEYIVDTHNLTVHLDRYFMPGAPLCTVELLMTP